MIPNPWVLPGIVLAWLASLASVGYWQRHDGAAATKVYYEQRDNEALKAANETIERLNSEARAAEQAHSAEIARIGTDHENAMQQLEARRRSDVDSARAGAIRLRDPGMQACPSAAPEAPAAAAGSDGPAPGELSGTAVARLLDLANDADVVATQLAACQAVILSDRKETP